MTLSDPEQGFKVTAFLKSDKVTITHYYETIPNISNGTMFGDLE